MKKFIIAITLFSSFSISQECKKEIALKSLESFKRMFAQWKEIDIQLDKIEESLIIDYCQARFYAKINDKLFPIIIYFKKDGKYAFTGQFIDIINEKSLTNDFAGEVKAAPVDISKINLLNSAFLGNPNAKIIMIEYADFQCPFCKKEFPILKEILKNYKDQIKFIYKHIPWPKHKYSKNLSIAAECARLQKN